VIPFNSPGSGSISRSHAVGIVESQDSLSAAIMEGEAVADTMGHVGCRPDQSHLKLRPVSRLEAEAHPIKIQQGCEVIMSAHLKPDNAFADRWTRVVMNR
jgi:hypothetical protein